MQTIVVPTDYSVASENAMFCAAELALALHSEIFLLHVYELPISMNDVPVLMIPADELRKNAEMGMTRTKDLLHKRFPELQIKTETRLGDFIYELDDVCNHTEPIAIVISKHDADGIDRFLSGNTVLTVIRNIKVPVITIPAAFEKILTNNILVAWDGSSTSEQQLKLKEFAKQLHATLHIIHVHEEKEKQEEIIPEVLSDLHPVYQRVVDGDFLHGVETYLNGNSIDLFLLMPHKHGFLERLFSKTHTAEVINKLKIPVVTIASG